MAMSSTSATVNTIAQMKAAGNPVVDFGPGEPCFPTPQHIKDAAHAAIEGNLTRYTPVPGTAELREAIVFRHRQDFGSGYSVEETIVCPGGKYALFSVMQVLIDEGDEVLLPVPYWVSFKDMVRFAGGNCVWIDTTRNEFHLTPQMVERAITPRTKAIILNYPNNPSGALLEEGEIAEIVDMAARRNIWVISDECYAYLTYRGGLLSAGSLKSGKRNVIIAGSLSKTYAMTGWRIGFALAPPSVIAAVQVMQSQAISCPSSVSQVAALAALTGPQSCIQSMRADYLRLRDRAVAALHAMHGLRVVIPGGAFYLFPEISEQLRLRGLATAGELCLALLTHGVVTVGGEGFGSNQHLRMSFAVSEDELTRGLDLMARFFNT
jgi:aspartate aminotransferase